MDGAGTQGEIEGRIKELKAEIEKSTSEYDKEKLQERLAKLAGGVAIINVGAATESEGQEGAGRGRTARNACRCRGRHRDRGWRRVHFNAGGAQASRAPGAPRSKRRSSPADIR